MKKATKVQSNIDFLGKRKTAMVLSGTFILASVISLFIQGLQFGLDFTGGTLVEVGYQHPVDLKRVRGLLDEGGISNATVQQFGTSKEILIRLAPQKGESSADLSTKVLEILNTGSDEQGEQRRVEFVGPQVGSELTEDGGLALLASMGCILLYVAWRFEYRFAFGSVAALGHDVIVTLGIFSIFGMDFDLTVLAALLAVIGYSLNDTIVVYDRIRENFRKIRKGKPVEIMNISLNQILTRTIITSLTTLLVLFSLAIFGGEIIHNFAIALIIGVVVGTYSSIYIASPIVLSLGVSKADLMLPEKEGSVVDNRP